MKQEQVIEIAEKWFELQGWQPFQYQRETWRAYLEGWSGLVNAPTGSGKTYALGLGILMEYLSNSEKPVTGLQAIWITPIRALSTEIQQAMQKACNDLSIPWEIAVRTGDTSVSERDRQRKHIPPFLITTPESLHLLLASKNHTRFFKNLKCLVADEWHELLGSKRAVQLELALSHLKVIQPALKIWGVSATIGNLKEGLNVLLGQPTQQPKHKIIRAHLEKEVQVTSLIPPEIEKFPWAGHLGIKMLDQVVPIIIKSKTTLLFTNTRSQSEIWYHRILEHSPDLAGIMALHHGSISRDLRTWVENALHQEKLKLVVCTSSLDLGVDFRPVETIIQVGSPKGVARFIQRAGRSGHQPGAKSHIYFVPTHSLELVEAAALRTGIQQGKVESRQPYIQSFDVLIQYLVTLAVSDGFEPGQVFKEIKTTYAFQSISEHDWYWVLQFITTGGESLHAYQEYQKLGIVNGRYHIKNRRFAMRHRLSIGTIVGDNVLKIKYMSGKFIGTIEEWFISKLNPGDVFWFAGKNLEFIKLDGLTAFVRRTREKKGKVPSWMGGRMPLSSQLSALLRRSLNEALDPDCEVEELRAIRPLIEKQLELSMVPGENEFLIEKIKSREGYHVFMFPFEGRFVHEGIAALVAYRMAQIQPISFSIALNDYGFELLSDQDIPLEEALELDLFSSENLLEHLQASLNANEMARAKFRDIAAIAGLTFKGYPGNYVSEKHLQSSSRLFFDMFYQYDAENLLFRQAYQEVMEFQLQETRMRDALKRISGQKLILQYPDRPTPFAFPILVDRLRERMSSERLEDRVKKMTLQYDK
ncbi:MAG: ligase-associated DNA damage response DEXH box helicase [Candidatus Cyclobacteriaceae bacterium M3_2C_046]